MPVSGVSIGFEGTGAAGCARHASTSASRVGCSFPFTYSMVSPAGLPINSASRATNTLSSEEQAPKAAPTTVSAGSDCLANTATAWSRQSLHARLAECASGSATRACSCRATCLAAVSSSSSFFRSALRRTVARVRSYSVALGQGSVIGSPRAYFAGCRIATRQASITCGRGGGGSRETDGAGVGAQAPTTMTAITAQRTCPSAGGRSSACKV